MKMARFQNRLRPVDSRKHVIDVQGVLVAAAVTTVVIADTVDSPVLATADQVRTGSRINSIFLNVQVAATGTAALANVYMILVKNAGNNLGAAIPAPNAVGTSDAKKYVIHQEMIMTEKNTTAIPRTLFKGVLKLPRHYQRFGYDDRLQVQLLAPGVNFDFCVQAIYKDYT